MTRISGGKFANGAQTGAFQYLFNQAGQNMEKIMSTLSNELKLWRNAVTGLLGGNDLSKVQGRMQINENFEALGKEALTLTVDATIIAGDIAGYCPLPKCQAISYGGAVIGLAYYGDASNLAGNAAGELANQYVKGKVKIFMKDLRRG